MVRLPPGELRSDEGLPLEDGAFRAAARSSVRRLVELCGLRSSSSVLDVGCGPGTLAIGLAMEFGDVARYVGVDARQRHIEWCTQALTMGDLEFIWDEGPDQGGRFAPDSFVLPNDERFDVVVAASLQPVGHPQTLSSALRVFRHYVTDDGMVLLGAVADPGTASGSLHPDNGPAATSAPLASVPFGGKRFVELVEQAGLAVEHASPRHPDLSPTCLVVSPRGGRGKFSRESLADLGRQEWVRRRLEGLEHRCRVLDDERTALMGRLDARQAEHLVVVEELKGRLKQSTRDVRIRDRRINELQQRLHEAERTLGRRSVRAVISMSNVVPRSTRGRVARVGSPLGGADRAEQRESTPRPSGPPSSDDALTAPSGDDAALERSRSGRERSHVQSVSDVPFSEVAPHSLVVYTATVGSQDELPAVVQFADSTVRFVCFSDVERADPRGWEILPIEYYSNDPKRTAMFIKTHPHLYFTDRDWSLWIDASVGLSRRPIDVVHEFGVADSDLVAFRRGDEIGVSGDADRTVRLGLDVADVVEDQMRRYAAAGLPGDQHLYETDMLLRRHNTERIIAFDERWWAELESGSRHDQISFAYLCWSTDVSIRAAAPVGTGLREHPAFECQKDQVAPRFRLPRNTHDAAKARQSWNLVRRHDASRPVEARESVAIDVDVVVPIHDALAHVQRCVRSIESDRSWSGEMFLVDDGSNESTSRWCRQFAEARPRVHLRRHTEARGFAAASNAGLAESSAPYVVVLNSDTVVSTGWLTKMRRVMTSNSSVGLVGPLSNAASWQSIPRLRNDDGSLAVNSLPAGVSLEEMNTFLEELTHDLVTPLVPLLNGFSLMFRRELLNDVGGFDADLFPRGYGEDVDLALRATDAGYLCAVAADTYVFHAKSQSFGAVQRDDLKVAGRDALRNRYGIARLDRVAASTRQHPALEFIRGATERLYTGRQCSPASPRQV